MAFCGIIFWKNGNYSFLWKDTSECIWIQPYIGAIIKKQLTSNTSNIDKIIQFNWGLLK